MRKGLENCRAEHARLNPNQPSEDTQTDPDSTRRQIRDQRRRRILFPLKSRSLLCSISQEPRSWLAPERAPALPLSSARTRPPYLVESADGADEPRLAEGEAAQEVYVERIRALVAEQRDEDHDGRDHRAVEG